MDLKHFKGGLAVIDDPERGTHRMGRILGAEIPVVGQAKITCDWICWKADQPPDKELFIALGGFCASGIGCNGKSGVLLESRSQKHRIILLRK